MNWKVRQSKQFALTPEELLQLASFYAEEEGTALLYSGGNYECSNQSYLFLFPIEKILLNGTGNPWEELKEKIHFDSGHTFPEWVGYIGYEMGAHADSEKELPFKAASTPAFYFQRYAVSIALDHRSNTAFMLTREERGESPSSKHEKIKVTLSSGETEETYMQKIQKAKEWIYEGEIYQINLSQQFHFKNTAKPFDIFLKLVKRNPSPFSAFLNAGNFTILSASPERFLKLSENELETRPIKGTSPRGKSPEEDLQNRESLLNSEKERAELLMITDLMRNDLGKVSLPGTVKTEKIWACESYTDIHHLYSIIRSRVLSDWHPVDVIRACFPGGSITGCPKLRAMELIHKLEQRPRGIYTGSIGYFTGAGDFDFNIAIRTLVLTQDLAELQLGGGIVADSEPKKEYEETLHKGASIFSVLN